MKAKSKAKESKVSKVANRIKRKQKEIDERKLAEILFSAQNSSRNHNAWIARNPAGTLAMLFMHLHKAAYECSNWADELILENLDNVGPELYHELRQWQHEDDDNFDYRMEELISFTDEIHDLIDLFGPDLLVTRLSKLTKTQIAAAAKRQAA